MAEFVATAERAWRDALKRAGDWRALGRLTGRLGAAHMRLVRATSSLIVEPGNPYEIHRDLVPFIASCWHGQQLMSVYLRSGSNRLRCLISKSRDGEAGAAYLESFGVELVRGSGGRERKMTTEKGGVRAFLELKKSLDEGVSVGTIADIPNTVARRCGPGIIALARSSGRPILPTGFATSRWVALRSWDRATFHMPFSRGAAVIGEPIMVPRDADEALLEAKRLELEHALNAASDRAYALVGKHRDWTA